MIKRQSPDIPAANAEVIAARRQALLAWYRDAGRELPWRYKDGAVADPYRVWLSEIMLQQTTVAAVKPYFQRFLDQWPTIADLACADLDDVLKAWAGLGYYARARNLHKCASVVASDYGGNFPPTVAELKTLPGIGTYTAAAIGAIAFGQDAVPVDGNVIRVLSRLHGVTEPMPAKKAVIESIAALYAEPRDTADFAQSLIELGAILCKDRNPSCETCPVAEGCEARLSGNPEAFPVKVKKKPKPTKHGWVFWIEDGRGRVLLRRRPDTGLLGGMMELPGSEWLDDPITPAKAEAMMPVRVELSPVDGSIRHTFTHFHLELSAMVAQLSTPANPPEDCAWYEISELENEALPTVMKKAARLVQAALAVK